MYNQRMRLNFLGAYTRFDNNSCKTGYSLQKMIRLISLNITDRISFKELFFKPIEKHKLVKNLDFDASAQGGLF